MFLKVVSFFFPWAMRRRILNRWLRYEIHPNAKIGLAWVFPKKLIMQDGASIDHFTIAVNLDSIKLDANAKIGRGNWITGFPTNTNSKHFSHQLNRRAELQMGEAAAITKNHHLDCTSKIEIGRFSTVAGYRSQLLTHSIDLMENRQNSLPISIGEYAFVGTNVVILGGASLPSRSILGAKSLLNKSFTKEWTLYGGVPAQAIREIPKSAKYFSRKDGFVY